MKRRFVASLLLAPAMVLVALSGCGGPWERTNEEVIAFVSGSEEDTDVFVKGPGGWWDERLVRTPGDDFAPAWSPDGEKIAYIAEDEEDAYVVDARDGSDPTRLFAPGFVSQPVWSPDGRRIAFISFSDDGLYVMNQDGTGVERLAGGVYPPWYPPSWSPDGTRIAYTAGEGGDETDIVVVGSDGTDPEVVQTGAHSPAWRPTNGEGVDR